MRETLIQGPIHKSPLYDWILSNPNYRVVVDAALYEEAMTKVRQLESELADTKQALAELRHLRDFR